jgi:hypothetical protein
VIPSLLLAIVLVASPQVDTIRVGHPSAPGALPAGVDTVDAYLQQNGERLPTVTFVQTIAETPDGFLVVQENVSRSGSTISLDSIAVARGTLATVWHGDVTPEGSRHVAFSPGRMAGTHADTLGHETPIDASIPDRMFDYSLLTLIADRLPLAEGFSATIALYDITRGPVYVPIRVTATESVSLGGLDAEAWKMEVDLGPRVVTRWVERSTGRELRWSVELPDGRTMVGERRHR